MPRFKFRLSNVIAIVIAIAMVAWLGSGVLLREKELTPTIAERNAAFQVASRDAGPTSVRTLISTAQPTSPVVTLRGSTRHERTIMVRTETEGRVQVRPVDRGSRVEQGELLCELAVDDREVRLEEAIAARQRAELDYSGALELSQTGLISEVELASRNESLARARSLEFTQRIELERTKIRAPFAGVVEETQVEVGDFLKRGEPCATLLDLDPMLVVGQVSEFEVDSLTTGSEAEVSFLSGESVKGRVRFLGRDSSDGTRTYRVEVEVPNPHQSFRSGVTAEIRLPLQPVLAHRILPNLLRLDDVGRIGIYTVSVDNRAEFRTIDILLDDATGFWVTGLPRVAQLVVRGQGALVPGQSVNPERVSALSSRADSLPLENQGPANTALIETPAG